jgi:integrase
MPQLTDVATRTAKPSDKTQRLYDGGGLYLEITPAGGKYWRFKYQFAGKEKRLALGVYPAVSLKAARDARDEARTQLQRGSDPAALKKTRKARQVLENNNTFEHIAHAWFEKAYADKADITRQKVTTRLQQDVYPWLGWMPVADIKPSDIISVITRIEQRGAVDLAARTFNYIQRILQYADTLELVPRDVSASIDISLVLSKRSVKHHAAITSPAEVHAMMRAIQGFTGSYITRCALLMSAYTFVRPGELRHAAWADINLDDALWIIPAAKMKMGADHVVPLATQAVAVLRELHRLTGSGDFVFPSERSRQRPMSENTVNAALRRMGYTKDEMTAHGFRATARTLLDELLGFRPDFIEHQLAHAVRDPNGRAYNRTAHLEERRKMMQVWADWLEVTKG